MESLRCCDEILVLDSGSNDRTVEIARKLGARVEEASWHGYSAQKNIAAELASHDWILSLDADESLSEALEAELWHIKKTGPQCDGYTVPRLAQYLGRWILHSGWYPDRKVRFFNRQQGALDEQVGTRISNGRGPGWASEIEYSPFHMQFAFRALEIAG